MASGIDRPGALDMAFEFIYKSNKGKTIAILTI